MSNRSFNVVASRERTWGRPRKIEVTVRETRKRELAAGNVAETQERRREKAAVSVKIVVSRLLLLSLFVSLSLSVKYVLVHTFIGGLEIIEGVSGKRGEAVH